MFVTPTAMLLLCLITGCLRDADENGTQWIGVAGDSNSRGATWWVSYAAKTLVRTPVLNGAVVVKEPVRWLNEAAAGASCAAASPSTPGSSGFEQVAALIAAGADTLILAFGTNDLRPLFRQSPQQVVECYQALIAMAGGRQVLVATTPPTYGENESMNPKIDELNTLVRARFSHVVEFHDGFTVDMFAADGLHLNETGWRLRTVRAVEAVLAL